MAILKSASLWLAVLLVAVAIYLPGLEGSFFFDDEPSILYAEGVRLDSLNVESLREALASGRSGPSGRPVAQLSFALNHYFSGFDPFAFKATNLAIHLLCGMLVFWLALRLLASQRPEVRGRQPIVYSGLVALLWLLHPIQLTPVLHVVQRMTSLSALFLLAALLLHVMARERGGLAGVPGLAIAWGILWPLSFFSKETGALFPLFALAWELILRRSHRGGLDGFARAFAVLSGLTFIGAAVYLAVPAGAWLWAGYALRDFSPVERLLTEGRVLWFYLGLILLPRLEALGLYHDDIAVSTELFIPWTTLPAWAGLIFLVWLAWCVRQRMPLTAFGVAWFLIGHGLESTFLPLEIAHEHRNYVPLLGILLAGVDVLARMQAKGGPLRVLGLTLAVAALFYFSFVTLLRSNQFGEEVRRTQIEAQHHRGSARAQYEAGRVLAGQDEAAFSETPVYSFARAHFERAGEIDGNFKLGWLGLIYLNCRAGMAAEPAWIDELARRLRNAPFGPGDSGVLLALKEMAISGSICLKRKDVEFLFSSALANPTAATHSRTDLHSWLADYFVLGARDPAAARIELDRALAIAPYNSGNLLKLAQLAILQGRGEEARNMLHRVEKLPLKRADRELLAELRRCLANGSAGPACVGK
ncbi:MAG: tetratricopeptide repeat protein [Rhodocyclaceae bacterium]